MLDTEKGKTITELIFMEVIGGAEPYFLELHDQNPELDSDIQAVYAIPVVQLLLKRLDTFIPDVRISANVAVAIATLATTPTVALSILAEMVRFAANQQGTNLITMEHLRVFKNRSLVDTTPETFEDRVCDYTIGEATVFDRADFWRNAEKGLPYTKPQ